MPAKRNTGGINAADVEAKLPAGYFVMRGHIRAAFGFTEEEIRTLIDQNVFRAEYPFGKATRARFVRSQVLGVARRWEGAA